VISEIDLYEVLAQQLGNEKAKVLVQYVEAKVDKRLEEKKSEFILERDKDKLLTKADALLIFATKEDLAKSQVVVLRTIYLVGIAQLLSIIGAVIAILKFMK
jgi:hypothetical protein